jgi:hypothetical protein
MGNWLLNGLIGGLVAGIAQGLVAMVITFFTGHGLFWPLINIGYMFRPAADPPLSDDSSVILRGLVIHMVVTAALGVLFALIAWVLIDVGYIPLWLWGILYAVIIWSIDVLGLLRIIDPTMARNFNYAIFLVSHLVYGAVLGWWMMRVPL